MPLLEILTIVAGIIYGYIKPGKEDRFDLFKKGMIIGIILGLIFTILGIFADIEFLLMSSMIGFFIFLEIIIITIFFIIGSYIGDWLEEKSKHKGSRDDRPWK